MENMCSIMGGMAESGRDNEHQPSRSGGDTVAEGISALGDLVGALGQESTEGVPTFVAGRRASELIALSLAVLAEAVRWLIPFDERDAHAGLGFTSPARHLEATAGCSAAHGQQLVRVARFCARHERTAAALREGEINVDQVDLLARFAHDLAEPYAEHETDLLNAATDRPTEGLTRLLRQWRWRVSETAAAQDTERAWEQRSLTLNHDLFGGAYGRFRLDPVGAEILAAALDTPPDPEGPVPPRSLAQRRADTLVDLAAGDTAQPGEDPEPHNGDASEDGPTREARGGLQLSAGGLEPTGRRAQRVGIELVVDLGTFTGDTELDIDALRADLAHGGTISPQVLEQLICDASLRRVLMAGPSLVLDVGEATPIISTGLRRAVQIRDRHCQFAGCTTPWLWCDIHHLLPRRRGGLTEQANLVLLCRRHHSMIHQGGYALARQTGGTLITYPPAHRTEQQPWGLKPNGQWTQPPPGSHPPADSHPPPVTARATPS